MSSEIKAIIFDMGGVIILTCDDTPRKNLAKQLKVPVAQLTDEVFNSQTAIQSEKGQLSKHEHWKKVLLGLGSNITQSIEEIDEAFWAGDRIDDELMSYIKSLKNKYRLGLLSNAFKGAREWVEGHFHFLDAFDLVVFSYEVGLRKPDPTIFIMICEKLNVFPQQAIFIDDMLANVDGAREAGLHAIHYQGKKLFRIELESLLNSL